MTTASAERFERTPRFREAFETKLKRARLAIREYFTSFDLETAETVHPVEIDHLDTETSDRIAFAYTQLAEEPDRRLAFMVDGSKQYDANRIPHSIQLGISDAADQLLDTFPPDAMSDKDLYYLARTSDITGDRRYLEVAHAYAQRYGAEDKLIPHSIEALHLAAMNGIAFDSAYAQSKDAHRNDIPMRLRAKTPKNLASWHSGDNNKIPMSEYEYLFAEGTRTSKLQSKEAQSDTEPLAVDSNAA